MLQKVAFQHLLKLASPTFGRTQKSVMELGRSLGFGDVFLGGGLFNLNNLCNCIFVGLYPRLQDLELLLGQMPVLFVEELEPFFKGRVCYFWHWLETVLHFSLSLRGLNTVLLVFTFLCLQELPFNQMHFLSIGDPFGRRYSHLPSLSPRTRLQLIL